MTDIANLARVNSMFYETAKAHMRSGRHPFVSLSVFRTQLSYLVDNDPNTVIDLILSYKYHRLTYEHFNLIYNHFENYYQSLTMYSVDVFDNLYTLLLWTKHRVDMWRDVYFKTLLDPKREYVLQWLKLGNTVHLKLEMRLNSIRVNYGYIKYMKNLFRIEFEEYERDGKSITDVPRALLERGVLGMSYHA